MLPFEESQNCRRIHQHYESLKNLPARIRETELPALEAIMSSRHFDRIASAFQAIEEYFGSELTTADRSFVGLKLLEIQANREEDSVLADRMQASIEKLQELISALDEQTILIRQKHEWLMAEVERYEASLPDIQQQIEIIESQNQKLKANPKGSCTKGDPRELNELLGYYRCGDRPFPKNKTEALMLVNRIESLIQQLEMKKLSQYL